MKVEYLFDPFEMSGVDPGDLPSSVRKRVLEDVEAFVLESVLLDVSNTKSPVTGERFQALSPEYKARKKAEGGTPVANLLMDGDLLDSLQVKRKGDSLVLTVSEDQQGKADGHNDFSGKSNLPRRPFIPDEKRKESFRPGIERGIASIVREALVEYMDARPEPAVAR